MRQIKAVPRERRAGRETRGHWVALLHNAPCRNVRDACGHTAGRRLQLEKDLHIGCFMYASVLKPAHRGRLSLVVRHCLEAQPRRCIKYWLGATCALAARSRFISSTNCSRLSRAAAASTRAWTPHGSVVHNCEKLALVATQLRLLNMKSSITAKLSCMCRDDRSEGAEELAALATLRQPVHVHMAVQPADSYIHSARALSYVLMKHYPISDTGP